MPSLIHTLLSLALLLPTAAAAGRSAGKDRPGRQSGGGNSAEKVEPLKNFDTNGNREIDSDELPAMQMAFAAMKRLDKNANGEIEAGELQAARSEARGQVRSRAAEAMKRADKNGNRRIDADEVSALERMLAKGPSEMRGRLDQNGDGKLDGNEVARLNERIAILDASGGIRRPGGASFRTPAFRQPVEKSPEGSKPDADEPIKPAEKPAESSKARPTTETRPFQAETPPNKFGS